MLDQVFKGDPNIIIDLLKLEAEGHELEVLIGAKDMVKRTKYVSADVSFERDGTISTLPDVVNFLLPRGFKVVDFSRYRNVILFKNTLLVN